MLLKGERDVVTETPLHYRKEVEEFLTAWKIPLRGETP